MNTTDLNKKEFGKKVTVKESRKVEVSTIVIPQATETKTIVVRKRSNIASCRTHIDVKTANLRKAYQKINRKLGEN